MNIILQEILVGEYMSGVSQKLILIFKSLETLMNLLELLDQTSVLLIIVSYRPKNDTVDEVNASNILVIYYVIIAKSWFFQLEKLFFLWYFAKGIKINYQQFYLLCFYNHEFEIDAKIAIS